jgi:hypothetical protein
MTLTLSAALLGAVLGLPAAPASLLSPSLLVPVQGTGVDFGDDSGEYPADGECDDPRFTGPGTHGISLAEDERADATDCRRLCEAGEAWLK